MCPLGFFPLFPRVPTVPAPCPHNPRLVSGVRTAAVWEHGFIQFQPLLPQCEMLTPNVRPADFPTGLEPLCGAPAATGHRLHGSLDFVFPPHRPAGPVTAEPQGFRQKSTSHPAVYLSSRDAEFRRHFRVADKSLSHCNAPSWSRCNGPGFDASAAAKLFAQCEDIKAARCFS